MHKKTPFLKVRPAALPDADTILKLAETAGSGLTTLPADSAAIRARLSAQAAALRAGNGTILLVLEGEDGVFGTGSVITRLGEVEPFFSYKTVLQRRKSELTGACVETRVLQLVTDFHGCSEVGSLFVDAAARKSGAGRLIARSRYLFIAAHRAWFADRVVAELRGAQDETGSSPFWDAVGRHFYQMSFAEADLINGRTGSQIIRELGPAEPIHINLLPPSAQAVIGDVHKDGRRALELLLEEGFARTDYVDIFDAGPTVVAQTDALRALKHLQHSEVLNVAALEGGVDSLVGIGHAETFRVGRGLLEPHDGGATLDTVLAEGLAIQPGDKVIHVPF